MPDNPIGGATGQPDPGRLCNRTEVVHRVKILLADIVYCELTIGRRVLKCMWENTSLERKRFTLHYSDFGAAQTLACVPPLFLAKNSVKRP